MDAWLAGIAYHLPEHVLTNAQLGGEHPEWEMEKLGPRIGIASRHVASPGECASDLAFHAANHLLDGLGIRRADVDFLLFCTQSPDYLLPTTACLLQDRLGLSTSCGALDYNLGCSGYPYGLALAKGLVAGGVVRNVLLLTGETYSRLLHPDDRSVRPIFGDGASASWITAAPGGARIGACSFGTDGAGAGSLIVREGGSRGEPRRPRGARHEQGGGDLFMDGMELIRFCLKRVPEVVEQNLRAAGLSTEDVDRFVLHQANSLMTGRLRSKLGLDLARAPDYVEAVGNTVSATIPIVLCEASAPFRPGERVMLVGFGVGLSWAACLLDWQRPTMVGRAPTPPSPESPPAPLA